MNNNTEEANSEGHYLLIAIGVVITIIGVYFRFAADPASGHAFFYNCVSNIILIIGVALSLKAVFAILK